MEDYEKKYEQALERAKNYYEGHTLDVNPKAAIEYVFPELKESEDERIRKEIIEALKQLDREKCPVDTYPYLDWIAWLEKQCVDISSFPEEQRKYMEKYVNLDKTTLVKLLAERDENVEESLKACISGGEVGVELARDTRYKENLEVKEVDLKEEIDDWYNTMGIPVTADALIETAQHFFELGIQARKKE